MTELARATHAQLDQLQRLDPIEAALQIRSILAAAPARAHCDGCGSGFHCDPPRNTTAVRCPSCGAIATVNDRS